MKVFWSDIEGFGEDLIFVIYKGFGRGLKCSKWAKKDYLQQCSKALQVRRERQN
jgi:hypothetical protein